MIDNGSRSSDQLRSSLVETGARLSVCKVEEPYDLDGYDGTVISGRSISSKESNVFNSKIIFSCKSKRTPLLGICFGAEIIATTLGSTRTSLDSYQNGFRKITVTKKNELLDMGSFVAHEAHRYKVMNLSKELEAIASSSVCEIEAFRARNHQIYGVQFHPESSGATGLEILANFLRICSSNTRGMDLAKEEKS